MEGKVLIANRGEIAIRIMKACRDLGLDYCVVYTDADRDSEHVQLNHTAGPDKNAYRITSYTEPNDLFAVADHAGCSAIHPGYGFSPNWQNNERRFRPQTFNYQLKSRKED